MCGIVGVCYSSGSAEHALIAGLKSLEYRGYDSAGVALHAEGMPRRRAEGRVDDLVAVGVDDLDRLGGEPQTDPALLARQPQPLPL